MWETICDALASWSGWKFGSKIPVYPILGFGPQNTPPPPRKLKFRQILAFYDFSILTCGEYPPPPPIHQNWNLGRSWHFMTFQFWPVENPPVLFPGQYFYRPQEKVMFERRLSVILFTGGGGLPPGGVSLQRVYLGGRCTPLQVLTSSGSHYRDIWWFLTFPNTDIAYRHRWSPLWRLIRGGAGALQFICIYCIMYMYFPWASLKRKHLCVSVVLTMPLHRLMVFF